MSTCVRCLSRQLSITDAAASIASRSQQYVLIPAVAALTELRNPDSPTDILVRVRRIDSLDGLRGIAAGTVLLHHGLLLFPTLAEPYYTNAPKPFGSFEWWAIHTPLHVLWEGKAGVYVFFVLSGFVLTLMATRRTAFNWVAYYPHRLLRLYLPVWAAVVLAIATFYLVPRVSPSGAWLEERPETVTLTAIIRDLTLVAGNGGLASPLWSLTWEILFSIALPLVILACVWVARAHWSMLALCVIVTTAGGVLNETSLMYPPMFIVGVILALRRDHVREWCSRVSTPGWIGIIVFATLATTSRWLVMAFDAPRAISQGTAGVMLIGAAMFLIIALEWRWASRILNSKPLRWLGMVSFSLYLVHEPIIVAAGFAFPDAPLLALLASIAITAAVAPGFYYAVERPSIQLAARVRMAISARRQRAENHSGQALYDRLLRSEAREARP